MTVAAVVLSMVLNSVRLKHTITFPLCVFKFLSFMHWTVSYECWESPKMNTAVLFMYFWPGKLASLFFVMLYFHQISFFQSIFISLVAADSQDGRLEEQRERKWERERCLFFSSLFITMANQELRASLLHSVASLPVLSFLSNTIGLHSHLLYLFI